MSKMDEMIVVSPRSSVFDHERLAFHGFEPLESPRAHDILKGLCRNPYTARRGDVEDDGQLLQPIPYVVVTRTVAGSLELFTYTRLAGGGERRLHGRVSIGLGGHMNRRFDLETLRGIVQEEAARELEEELRFRDGGGADAIPGSARLLGLINDDTGDVQRVHIGLLAIVEVPPEWLVEVRETERLEGSWKPVAEVRQAVTSDLFEEWSVHALAGLDI